MADYSVSSGATSSGLTLGGGDVLTVSSGGAARFTTVSSGGTEQVLAGGTATSTTVRNGGFEDLSGGAASFTAVGSGGAEQVFVGGSAVSTTLALDGDQSVSSGGRASFTAVNSGGGQDVYAGGAAVSATLNSGGIEVVEPGGTASFTTMAEAGFQVVLGGTAIGTTVGEHSTEDAIFGGTTRDTTVASGGDEAVSHDGSATSTTVNRGGTEDAFSDGITSFTTVAAGGTEGVSSGGVTISTAVDSGGAAFAGAGGTASFTILDSGGVAFVFAGGTASGTTVRSGGYLVVLPGGVQSGTSGAIVSTGVLLDQPGAGIVVDASTTGVDVGSGGTEYVLPSGTTTSTTLRSGGTEVVYIGGAASFTTVSDGGFAVVSSGGTAIGTVVSDGGIEVVSSGGMAGSTTVVSFGIANVSAGGTASLTTVSGGNAFVYSGGAAIGTTIDRAGTEFVYFGGATSFAAVSGGGTEFVHSGGSAISAAIGSGGAEVVSFGGTASFTTVSNGGDLVVLPGGTQTSTTVLAGGEIVSTGVVVYQPGAGTSVYGLVASDIAVGSGASEEYVLPGGTTSFSTVSSGGVEVVYSGGTTVSTALYGGFDPADPFLVAGTEFVSSGGTASFTMVSRGGNEQVYGTTVSTTVNSGGTDDVYNGGTASFTVVSSGGSEDVFDGGTTTDTTVDNGGTQEVTYGGAFSDAGGTAIRTTVDSGGYQVVSGGTTSDATVDNGGTVLVQAGTAISTTVDGGGFELLSAGGTIGGGINVYGSLAAPDGIDLGQTDDGSTVMTVGSGGTVTDGGSLAIAGFSLPGGSLGAVMMDGGELTALGQVDVGQYGAGSLLIENQASVFTGTDTIAVGFDLGAYISASPSVAAASGIVTVTGSDSLLLNTGEFIVGDGGLGSLAIEAGGSVITTPGTDAGFPSVSIADSAGASGSSVKVVGAGSDFLVNGTLVVGNAAEGSLNIAAGATVTATSLIAAAQSGGDGVITIAGTGSELAVTGSVTLGAQGAGELAILSGATASALDLTIGGTPALSSGNVDVEGAGSELSIATGGALNIGVADGGSGVLTIGSAAVLNFAGIPVESGHASFNNYGTVDPDGFEYTTASNGNAGLNLYDLYIGNIGAVQVSSGTSTWFTPMVLTGTSVADATNNIGNGDIGEWQLSNGGTLVFNANTVDAGQAIVFEDATDTLVIGQQVDGGQPGVSGETPTVSPGAANLLAAGGFAAELWGYQAGDQILFDNLVVNSDSIVGGNTLELFGAGGTLLGELTFYNKAGTRPLGSSGMAAAAAQLECFAAGTRLLTARGEVAVEAIAVGERVRVLLGDACDGQAGDGRVGDGLAGDGLAEVIWVGRREVDCVGHPQPRKVWPVRVAAGAFGPGAPHTDLWLSPDHAVYVAEVLIPVKYLINGSTIVQVPVDSVTYHHIELAQHDVLLAEGLPVESYLDIKDGRNYPERAGAARRFPDHTARMWEAFGCARLVVTGPELQAARALVAEVAGVREAA